MKKLPTIITKGQLVEIILKSQFELDNDQAIRIYNKIRVKLLRMPELIFLEKMYNSFNFNLEIVRKNTYIIH